MNLLGSTPGLSAPNTTESAERPSGVGGASEAIGHAVPRQAGAIAGGVLNRAFRSRTADSSRTLDGQIQTTQDVVA
jgi:hypothetical protein